MKWQKLGQIFNFPDSNLKERFISHAQSPQALVLEDRVRVFFSTRKEDSPGNFLSFVQYIDYDFDFRKVLGYSNEEVMSLGKLGCFDEHGIFPLSPVKVGDKVYGYTNGISRRQSVAVETAVGLGISQDNGKTFKHVGDGPVLGPSLKEPFMVGDPFVRIFNETFHMFYIFGKKWSIVRKGLPPERVYKIAHATSSDGIEWQRASMPIIEDIIDENECQALPTVIQYDGLYHMYFCYRHMVGFRTEKGKGYKLGYAFSKDLVNWTRDDSKAGISLSESGWDSEMMCYPNIFKCKDDIYLLYNGNNFGKDGFGIAKLMRQG